MQSDNTQLSLGLQKKDEDNRQLASIVQNLEMKLKKAVSNSKNNKQYKKDAKEKDKELHKLRKEIIDLKHANSNLATQLKEAK